MVLRASPGETIEKSIQVINRNDVPVTIELSASGDLAEKIKFVADMSSQERQNLGLALRNIVVQDHNLHGLVKKISVEIGEVEI